MANLVPMEQKAVCISPLDWGLGHATRCISLMYALESLNYKVYIATDGKHEAILREAVPNATFLHLKGYRVWYTRSRALLIPGIIVQIPKIIASVVHEYFWLKRVAKKHKFDLIISDNRFGFFHKQIKSVFITHQLALQTPFAWSTRLNQIITYTFINKYAACWVADMLPPNNISGILANPKHVPNTRLWYMNCLSRLINEKDENSSSTINANTNLFLGIVSGPEPQRTLLENILWEEGNKIDEKFVVIAGLPDEKNHHQKTNKGNLYHHLNGAALKKEILNAQFIICRGGYTTLMELIPFQKKLILIPTPGQTEQEYLGKYWEQKKWAVCFSQSEFNVNDAIKKAQEFEYQTPPFIAFSKDALVNELKQLSL